MIYNYTTCESIIAKVMADLDMQESNIRTTDMREWIFEAVDKIGAPTQYLSKESGADGEPLLEIDNYQVPLPHGIQHLDGVAYSMYPKGPFVPVRKNTGTFKVPRHKRPDVLPFNPDNEVAEEAFIDKLHEKDVIVEKLPTSQSQLYTMHKGKYMNKFIFDNNIENLQYFIKPGWIVINRPHGFIKLAYKQIATDERGYPLIPDLTSYQEAIYWYVVMKLSFAKWMKGTLGGRGVNSGQNMYAYIQQQWNFYRNQAYAEAMMPTPDDMRSIKNDWTKLIPDWDSDDTLFRHQGDRQSIINDYYYGY